MCPGRRPELGARASGLIDVLRAVSAYVGSGAPG